MEKVFVYLPMDTASDLVHRQLPILTQEDQRLRQMAQSIPPGEPLPPEVRSLVQDLLATLEQSNGVGIAAPQVAQSVRLFIVASRPTPRYPHAVTMDPTVMVNPRILTHSQATQKDWEGCLSIPDQRGLVERYQWVEVEYQDMHGQRQHQRLTDFVARIFQHELDHLDGILFCDRLDPADRLISEAEYQDLVIKDLERLGDRPGTV